MQRLDKQQYQFNPHRHVKIWLSKDSHVFMNDENQLRLVQMRAACPGDEINLIYDSQLLSKEAQNKLLDFCVRHSINALDVRILMTQCKQGLESQLIAIYQDEITHLDEGGSLAAASDVLRWLEPIYCLGTYSDLDVRVVSKGLPSSIAVFEEFLLNIGSHKDDPEEGIVNNNIIAILNPQSPKIKEVQQSIINACAPAETAPGFIGDISIDPPKGSKYDGYLDQLRNLYLAKTPRQFRANIKAFVQCLKNLNNSIIEKDRSHHLLPMFFTFSDLLDHCSRNNPNLEQNLFIDSVITSTGPTIIDNLLPPVSSLKDAQELMYPYSISYYKPLAKMFSPLIPLWSKVPFERMHAGDLSWTGRGRRGVADREQQLHQNATAIQNAWLQSHRFFPSRKKCKLAHQTTVNDSHLQTSARNTGIVTVV